MDAGLATETDRLLEGRRSAILCQTAALGAPHCGEMIAAFENNTGAGRAGSLATARGRPVKPLRVGCLHDAAAVSRLDDNVRGKNVDLMHRQSLYHPPANRFISITARSCVPSPIFLP